MKKVTRLFDKPWEPENTEVQNLAFHFSELKKLEQLLTTYQYCDCEKTEEVVQAVKTIREAMRFKGLF